MTRFITYLLLDQPAATSADNLASSFKDLARGSPLTIEQPAPGKSPLGEALIMMVNRRPVSVMFVDRPLPRDAWEGAAARSITWPDSKDVAARTRAHVIIALLQESTDHESALYGAAAVTMVGAALARLLPVTAMVFSEAQSIIPGKEIIPAALSFARGRPPLLLWTSLTFLRGTPQPDGTPTTVGLTTGLRPFIGREIEFQAAPLQPAEMGQRILGLCHYLIVKGPVIKDGETVGVTEQEKVRVRYAAAGQRPGVPVMLLSAEMLQPTTPSSSAGGPTRTSGKSFGRKGL